MLQRSSKKRNSQNVQCSMKPTSRFHLRQKIIFKYFDTNQTKMSQLLHSGEFSSQNGAKYNYTIVHQGNTYLVMQKSEKWVLGKLNKDFLHFFPNFFLEFCGVYKQLQQLLLSPMSAHYAGMVIIAYIIVLLKNEQ